MEEVEWGEQRDFMCNAAAERSAFLLDSPAPRQGTKGRLTGMNPISSVTDLTHFVILLTCKLEMIVLPLIL